MSASGSEDFFVEAFSLEQDDVSNPVRLDDQVVILKLIEEKTMSEDDWETENVMFRSAFMYYQNDFTMMQLVNQLFQFAKKHYQNPQFGIQILFSRLTTTAEEYNIPYEYTFKIFLNINSDLEKVIEERKQEKAVDNFNATFNKVFGIGAR